MSRSLSVFNGNLSIVAGILKTNARAANLPGRSSATFLTSHARQVLRTSGHRRRLDRAPVARRAERVAGTGSGRRAGIARFSPSRTNVKPILFARSNRCTPGRRAAPVPSPADSPADKPRAARSRASNDALRNAGPSLPAAEIRAPAPVTRNRNCPLAVSSTRCCTCSSSISRTCSSCSARSG